MNIPPPAFGFAPAAAPAPAAPTAPATVAGPTFVPEEARMDELVLKYRRLRDKKKEINDELSARIAPYNEALNELEALLLDALNRGGVESSRTKSGTVFKTVRSGYTVKDAAEFRSWIEAHNCLDLLETRVSKEAVEERIRLGLPLPPGLGVSSTTVIGVRKPS